MIHRPISVLLLAILFFNLPLAAQSSDMDERKFRFGLMASPNLGWLRPNISELEKNGLDARLGFGYGIMLDYKFSESPNYLLSAGLNLTTGGGSITEPWETVVTESTGNFTFHGKNDRTHRLQYATIPVLLKMRTGDVGYMSYFGAVGFDLGFRTRARVNNDYAWVTGGGLQPADEKDLDISNEINLLRLALNITLGAEYNLTGNTNLYAGLGFHNGFTNMFNGKPINRVLKPKSDGNPDLDIDGNVIPSQQKKANLYYMSLDVGIYF